MARDARSLSWRAKLAYGVGCIALGCYPIALGLGFFPVEEARLNAPPWVVVAAGLAFVIAGFMILLAAHSRVNDLLAAVLLLLFSVMGIWVSIFSPSEGFSGGLPFLSRELNIMLGRGLFGLGSLISIAMCAYALGRAANKST